MTNTPKQAVLYRRVIPNNTCVHGRKALALLQRRGYRVEDRHLTSREAIDAAGRQYPRIGGTDQLRADLDNYLPVAAAIEDSDTLRASI
ncbi:MAG: hypothetical protein ACPG4D_08755, partial [Alphaproteobacteria bacterium]